MPTNPFLLQARSFTINVTKELIDEAASKDSRYCMIAQAIRKIGGTSTNVTAENVAFNMDGYRFTYPLPAMAAVELIKFDKDKKLAAPFKFNLSGTTGFIRPVIKRGPIQRKGTPKKRELPKVKRSWRRYHGIRKLEIFGEAR